MCNSFGLLPQGYCELLNLEKTTSSVLSVLLLIYACEVTLQSFNKNKVPIKLELFSIILNDEGGSRMYGVGKGGLFYVFRFLYLKSLLSRKFIIIGKTWMPFLSK